MLLPALLISTLPILAAADWSIKFCEDSNGSDADLSDAEAARYEIFATDLLSQTPIQLSAGQTLNRTVGDYTAWIWNFSPCAQPVSEAAFNNALRATTAECGQFGAAAQDLVTIGSDTSYVAYGLTTTAMFSAWTRRYAENWSWNLDERCCAVVMNKPAGRTYVPEQRACMESYRKYWHTAFLQQQGVRPLA